MKLAGGCRHWCGPDRVDTHTRDTSATALRELAAWAYQFSA